ncbi:hypothetical protein GXW78_14855 [Roseomonas terrae]|uniref:EF-hand domain-containing protein n=1 Tax=Neoroseomonas terrae TaxID=424799 RepID=A0ABS5EIU9_9PROT|nr:EF-hand domain-containing protein [Neoroseomonas terrae]MBR0650951.1 hypothetical protein [Neoroseomonas terrae]
MRKTTIAALSAVVLAGGIGLAVAQPTPGAPATPAAPGATAERQHAGPPGHRGGPHHGGPRGAGSFAMGEAFARADTNNDGKVSREEAMTWVQARFTEIDVNRDGATIEEFRAFVDAQRPQGRRGPPPGARQGMQQRGAAMFRFVDVNMDGRVTMDELRPMVEAAFRAADRDGDGSLSREEVRFRNGPGPRRGAPAAPAQPAPATPR